MVIVIIIAALFATGSGDTPLNTHIKGKTIAEIMERGRDYYRNGKPDSAMIIFQVVADQYDERLPDNERELCVLAMNNVGTISIFNYLDCVQAYNYLSRALDIAEDEGWTRTEAIICLNMAELFMLYSQHINIDTNRDKILEYSRRSCEDAYKSQFYECLGAVIANQLCYDLATPTAPFKVIFDAEIPNDVRNIAYARSLMHAAQSYQSGQTENARHILTESKKLDNSEWARERIHITYRLNIAQTYIKDDDIPTAEKWMLDALAHADSLGNTDQQLTVLSLLAALPGEYGSRYRLRYLEKKDEIMSSGRLAMVGELDFIRSLGKEREISNRLSESRRRLMVALGISMVMILIVSAFTIYILRQRAKLRSSNRELYKRIQMQLNQSIENREETSATSSGDKYAGSSLSSEKLEEINARIHRILNDPETVCSPDFTLSKLAALINVNTTYVSRVINEKNGCSFSSLINEYRVREACARIDNHKVYGNMTIEAISKSVGFSSRSTFVNAFKKINGMTPSEYLNLSKEMAGCVRKEN